MPMSRKVKTTGGQGYGRVFVGIAEYPAQIAVNITALTAAEVDADGYIKPGVPLQASGALVSGAAQVIFGVVPEPIKVANGNAAGDLAAASAAFQLTVITIGQVNRAIIEDNLGRVLSANEIAAFAAAGSQLKLLA
jgi:acyl-CoA hydrolase